MSKRGLQIKGYEGYSVLRRALVYIGLFLSLLIFIYACLRDLQICDKCDWMAVFDGRLNILEFSSLTTISLMFTTVSLNNVVFAFFFDKQKKYRYGLDIYAYLDLLWGRHFLTAIRWLSIFSLLVGYISFVVGLCRLVFMSFVLCIECCILLLVTWCLVTSKTTLGHSLSAIINRNMKKAVKEAGKIWSANYIKNKKDNCEESVDSFECLPRISQNDYEVLSNVALRSVVISEMQMLDSYQGIRYAYIRFLCIAQDRWKGNEQQKFIYFIQIYDATRLLCSNINKMENSNDEKNNGLANDLYQLLFESEISNIDLEVLRIIQAAFVIGVLESECRPMKGILEFYMKEPQNYFYQAIVFVFYEVLCRREIDDSMFYENGTNHEKHLKIMNFHKISVMLNDNMGIFSDIIKYWHILKKSEISEMNKYFEGLKKDFCKFNYSSFVPVSKIFVYFMFD